MNPILVLILFAAIVDGSEGLPMQTEDSGYVTSDGMRVYYRRSPERDPKGPDPPGATRVLRGGSWYDYPRDVRASGRGSVVPEYRIGDFGFRCAREVTP